jgi:3-keto-disaccharide hydrolase
VVARSTAGRRRRLSRFSHVAGAVLLAGAVFANPRSLIGVGQRSSASGAQGQRGGAAAADAGRGGGRQERGGQAEEGRVYGPDGVWWGLDNTPMIPGLPWRIHDANRPQPPVVKPSAKAGGPPGDAILLFGGEDLAAWGVRAPDGTLTPASWTVADGAVTAGRGTLTTRDSFGDVQLHVEFAMPSPGTGTSQSRGNSGLIFMGLYELQLLDSYNNRTYADGMAASIYGEWPPMVNIAAPPGEWQTLDVVFEAPRFSGAAVLAPAYLTVLWNGAVVHNRQSVAGPTSLLTVHQYTPHAAELPLSIQGRAPVRFRNVWIRRLNGYDKG